MNTAKHTPRKYSNHKRAAMLAAAPAMCEVVRSLVELYDSDLDRNSSEFYDWFNELADGIARQALAQAEGR